MYLRLFCSIDDSPIGRLALSYMPALVRVAPVRLVDPERMGMPDLPGRWGRYHRALETPMQGPFVNIVCTRPERWTWVQRIEAAVDNNTDPATPTETIEGRLELYTKGVRNVLITNIGAAEFAALEPEVRASAIRYEAQIRPDSGGIANGRLPIVDHAAFRRITLGE